ncbi:MAG: transglycosylase domain-containing protein [Anaerolineae bacterium]|nr:transglycosylase domain-containing protein [Anaerolineae bacterium]
MHRRIRRRLQGRDGAHRWVKALAAFAALVAALSVVSAAVGAGTLVVVYAYFAQDLPNPQAITSARENFRTSRIFDHTGEIVLQDVIDPFGGDRQWVTLSEIPDHLEWATIAIEDSTFYENPGFDLWGMGRALWNNFTGGYVQGASTITQQLVKQVIFDPETAAEVSMERKIRELILATEISRTYSKPQILEWYLNTIFYGNNAYGVEAAAQVYFGKSVRDVTMAEAAMLAAIPQSPGLTPADNFEQAKLRQLLVLDAMVQEGYISQREATEIGAQEVTIRPLTERYDILAPHFTIFARQQAERILNNLGYDGARLVSRGGLRIYTTVDLDLQRQAECVARTHVARLSGADPAVVVHASDGAPCPAAEFLPALPEAHQGWDHDISNASVVVLNAKTGEILAMVGSLDYSDAAIAGAFNVALGYRQPGSAFKPFTYVTAFAKGYTPATMVMDVRTGFPQGGPLPDYVPENYDRTFHGPMSIRQALANSYNVPAVEVTRWVGVDEVIRTAHRMGVNSLNQDLNYYGLSLTLGGGEVSLLDLSYAYSVFANMGEMRGTPVPDPDRRPGYRILDPVAIKRIEMDDPEGGPPIVLWQYGEDRNTFGRHTVLAEPLAFLMNDILSDTESRWPEMGRGQRARTLAPGGGQDRHDERLPR